ncbi:MULTISPECIES: hypothetical protein [unclassified Pseudoalteromonas]|jgi:hypothetical protein|uniref:hypothetical protein n=1 Tax=unclassified Pseudoalteromonas TaxID=194690 RepID=UPI00048CF595|nr:MULTISPECIES: hypothetical protein [unclassified Pseudoalteromonas]TMP58316.1 hypothetical protein CWB78_01085 [Pseudoalteromonas sp. S1612]
MPEPITTVGIGAIAAYLGKDGLQKLLGPTADYLGGELQEFTKKRIENVGKIFSKAEEKLGENIDSPGHVPPKVLKTIVNEGSYCEDEVAVDYFGGILASSRTELGRDDRGARIAKILDGMSTYQIRSHYVIYSLIKKVFSESGYMYNQDDRHKMTLFIPMNIYIASMQFDEKEIQQFGAILNHALFGLNNDDLIEGFQYGPQEDIKKNFADAVSDGIVVAPSAFGAELYLWGYGQGNQALSYALNAKELTDLQGVPLYLDGVVATDKEHNKSSQQDASEAGASA